jgi:hypothetical protein
MENSNNALKTKSLYTIFPRSSVTYAYLVLLSMQYPHLDIVDYILISLAILIIFSIVDRNASKSISSIHDCTPPSNVDAPCEAEHVKATPFSPHCAEEKDI